MKSPWLLLVEVGAGGLLGAIFFEALWFTTELMITSRRRWLVWLTSFVLRIACLGTGLTLIAAAGWQHLAAGCLGVLGGRFLIIRRHRPRPVAGQARGGP
jgi:F1F0 ATPase subunit 2